MATQSTGLPTSPEVGTPRPKSALPKELVDEMQRVFGKHPGFRTSRYTVPFTSRTNAYFVRLAHAKGLLVEGTFTPTEQAKTLSIAPHFNNTSTPVIARFSVGGGFPVIADTNGQATPKGLAIRFKVDNEIHTDLISHSFNGFATNSGEDFLTFLQLARASKTAEVLLGQAKPDDNAKEQELVKKTQAAFFAFLSTHEKALEFVNAPKPNPFNYGTITYYQPNTHVLINKDGKCTNVRYRLIPADGVQLYPDDQEQLAKLPPSYLEDDLKQRFPGKPIVFDIQAHLADPDDILDDATKLYKSTTFISVGRLEINRVADDNDVKQQHIAFSPTPEKGGVQGIESSNDPLIQTRKGVYWISADQRRHETKVESRM